MSSSSLVSLLEAVAGPHAGYEEWESLYRDLWPYVFTITYRSLAGNRAVAEEASQEVMLRLVRFGHFQDHPPYALLSFIRTACRSVISDCRKRERREQVPSDIYELANSDPSQEDGLINIDLIETVRNRLSRSDAKLAELVGHGASVEEIAAQRMLVPGTNETGCASAFNHDRKKLSVM